MRMFALPVPPQPSEPILGPLTPAAYLTLRRVAAGIQVDDFARSLVMLDDHRRPPARRKMTVAELGRRFIRAKDVIALLEKPGSVTRNRDLLRDIQALMPFDPAVYLQLADELADRHPRICRGCGCSGHDACCVDDSICHWVTPAICSHCVEGGIRNARVAA